MQRADVFSVFVDDRPATGIDLADMGFATRSGWILLFLKCPAGIPGITMSFDPPVSEMPYFTTFFLAMVCTGKNKILQ
eukprot:2998541-Amphidinium_carterae.1